MLKPLYLLSCRLVERNIASMQLDIHLDCNEWFGFCFASINKVNQILLESLDDEQIAMILIC